MIGVGAGEEEAACGELEEAAGEAPDVNRRAVLRAEDELRRAVQPATQLSPSDHAVLLFSGPRGLRKTSGYIHVHANEKRWCGPGHDVGCLDG